MINISDMYKNGVLEDRLNEVFACNLCELGTNLGLAMKSIGDIFIEEGKEEDTDIARSILINLMGKNPEVPMLALLGLTRYEDIERKRGYIKSIFRLLKQVDDVEALMRILRAECGAHMGIIPKWATLDVSGLISIPETSTMSLFDEEDLRTIEDIFLVDMMNNDTVDPLTADEYDNKLPDKFEVSLC